MLTVRDTRRGFEKLLAKRTNLCIMNYLELAFVIYPSKHVLIKQKKTFFLLF